MLSINLLKNKKFIKTFIFNIIIFGILTIPLGLILNLISENKFFLRKERENDFKCTGFTYDNVFGTKWAKCNDDDYPIGFTKEFELDQPKNILKILILGGSMASNLSINSLLEKNLNEYLLKLNKDSKVSQKYDQVKVFNAALGGAKQPQGLFTYLGLEMLGYSFDVVIELSGFNEIALNIAENYPNKINLIYPRLASQQFLDNSRKINKSILLNQLNNILWLHPLHQYLSKKTHLYTFLKVYIFDKKNRNNSSKRLGMNFMLPKNEKEAFDQIIKIWSNASSKIFYLNKKENVPYLLFFQPNQYYSNSKTLSDIEKQEMIETIDNQKIWYKLFKSYSQASLYGAAIQKYYPYLNKNLFNIPNKNIVDLRYIFKDNSETLYSDKCCHLNLKGRKILIKNISKSIFQYLEE